MRPGRAAGSLDSAQLGGGRSWSARVPCGPGVLSQDDRSARGSPRLHAFPARRPSDRHARRLRSLREAPHSTAGTPPSRRAVQRKRASKATPCGQRLATLAFHQGSSVSRVRGVTSFGFRHSGPQLLESSRASDLPVSRSSVSRNAAVAARILNSTVPAFCPRPTWTCTFLGSPLDTRVRTSPGARVAVHLVPVMFGPTRRTTIGELTNVTSPSYTSQSPPGMRIAAWVTRGSVAGGTVGYSAAWVKTQADTITRFASIHTSRFTT